MKMSLYFIITLLFLLATKNVNAGGGYAEISGTNPGTIGQKLYIQAKFNTSLFQPENIIGKRAEFVVRAKSPTGEKPAAWSISSNGVSGVQCITSSSTIDSSGMISGECTGTETGLYFIGVNLYQDEGKTEIGGYELRILSTVPNSKTTPIVTLTIIPTKATIQTSTIIQTSKVSTLKVAKKQKSFDIIAWIKSLFNKR